MSLNDAISKLLIKTRVKTYRRKTKSGETVVREHERRDKPAAAINQDLTINGYTAKGTWSRSQGALTQTPVYYGWHQIGVIDSLNGKHTPTYLDENAVPKHKDLGKKSTMRAALEALIIHHKSNHQFLSGTRNRRR